MTKGSDDPNAQLTATSSGVWAVAYDKLGALALEGVSEIASLSDTFTTNLIAWLGNPDNGITSIFAHHFVGDDAAVGTLNASSTVTGKTTTDKLCVTDGANDNSPVCLTKSQIQAMISASGASAATAAPTQITTSTSSSTPAVAAPVSTDTASSSTTLSPSSTATTTPVSHKVVADPPPIAATGTDATSSPANP